MPSINDFPALGRVLEVQDYAVIFAPINTTYQFRLLTGGQYDGPVGERMSCLIRATALKVYTVPSGGGFVQPISGPPRIIQGSIRLLDEAGKVMVLQAGAPIVITLPENESAFDLACGPLKQGILANVVALPGAKIELLEHAGAR